MRQILTLIILGTLLVSCMHSKKEERSAAGSNQIKGVKEDPLNTIDQNKQIASFLTFQEANAEEAMNFYMGLFDNSKVIDIQRYQKGEAGKEGTVKVAKFLLNGSPFMCSDSYIKHAWTFTPAVSIFVEIKTEEKISELFEKLSEGGKVLMPLGDYGFSKKFGFIEDRFGVSWQLNLTE